MQKVTDNEMIFLLSGTVLVSFQKFKPIVQFFINEAAYVLRQNFSQYLGKKVCLK